jgi:hypothetical protein
MSRVRLPGPMSFRYRGVPIRSWTPVPDCERLVAIDDIADGPMPRVRDCDPAWTAFWRIGPRPDGRRAPDGPLIEAIEDKFEHTAGQAVPIAAGLHEVLRPDIAAVPLEGVEPTASSAELASQAEIGAWLRSKLGLAVLQGTTK